MSSFLMSWPIVVEALLRSGLVDPLHLLLDTDGGTGGDGGGNEAEGESTHELS